MTTVENLTLADISASLARLAAYLLRGDASPALAEAELRRLAAAVARGRADGVLRERGDGS